MRLCCIGRIRSRAAWAPMAASLTIILLAAILPGCEALRNPSPTATTTVIRVGADDVARAMQEDRFYADYGHSTLLVHGIVSGVHRQSSHIIIELSTSVPTRVLCDAGDRAITVGPGDAITVQAPSADAQREPSAVMLANCSVS